MINPNKNLVQKALAGVKFLRMHAEAMADDDDFFIALMSEPHAIAARAIEQLVKENEELRAQLVAFQKAANPAVAIDPASGPNAAACHPPFTKRARVFLKSVPTRQGTVTHVRAGVGIPLRYWCFVCFDSEFEIDRWVDVKHLELIPDE
ncbi:hypothetical protein F2089_24305 [Salmonella enterica]|nr:hypothetical protein [Salmonella enterica]